MHLRTYAPHARCLHLCILYAPLHPICTFVPSAPLHLEAYVHVAVFGVALPLALGFAWALLLYFFAGVIIYVLLALLIACMLALTAWLASKTGWFDAEAVGWLKELGSGDLSLSELGELGSNLSANAQANAGALGAGAADGSLLQRAVADEQLYYQLGAVLSAVATVVVLMLVCFWAKCAPSGSG